MSWLKSPIHPTLLKTAIDDADIFLKQFYGKLDRIPLEHVLHEAGDMLHKLGLRVFQAGREYANSFSEMNKLAFVPDWDYTEDINKLLALMKVRPNRFILDEVHKALSEGTAPPVEKFAQKLGYDTGKGVARTLIMEIYIKSALRQWDEDGIKYVKRLAMEDMKTCPTCKALNGRVYSVDDLLQLPNPQSASTHVSCRCTFLPVIDITTYPKNVSCQT